PLPNRGQIVQEVALRVQATPYYLLVALTHTPNRPRYPATEPRSSSRKLRTPAVRKVGDVHARSPGPARVGGGVRSRLPLLFATSGGKSVCARSGPHHCGAHLQGRCRLRPDQPTHRLQPPLHLG